MSEIFYNKGDVTVDRSLARFGDTTYPIANIGSVSTKKLGSGNQPILGGLLALFGLFLAGATANTALGIILVVIGLVLYIAAKPRTAILLRTSSGDQQAFESTSKTAVLEIKTALEKAISSRG